MTREFDPILDFYQGKTVAVLGGAGFVGHVLVDYLSTFDCNVIVIDDFSRGKNIMTGDNVRYAARLGLDSHFPYSLFSIEYIISKLLHKSFPGLDVNSGYLKRLFEVEHVDIVFNLTATVAGVLYNEGHHAQMYAENIAVLSNPIMAAQEAGVEHYLQTSSVCLSGDTLVHTENGLVPIVRVAPGDLVLTESGLKSVSSVHNNGTKETVDIKFRSGQMLSATGDHLVMTVTDDGIEWVRADELQCGDHVVSASSLDTGYIENDDLAWLLGLWTGDGCYRGESGITIAQGESDVDVLHSAASVVSNELDLNPRFHERSGYWGPSYILDVSSTELVKNWKMDGIVHGSKNKLIPGWIYNSVASTRAAFVCGLFDADGCVNKARNDVSFSSASVDLAVGVANILTSLGIKCHFLEVTHDRPVIPEARFYGGESTVYEVRVAGGYIERYADIIGFRGERKTRELSAVLQNKRRSGVARIDAYPMRSRAMEVYRSIPRGKHVNGKPKTLTSLRSIKCAPKNVTKARLIQLDEYADDRDVSLLARDDIMTNVVESVSSGAARDVYDLTVPDTSSFATASAIVHNCVYAPENQIFASEDAGLLGEPEQANAGYSEAKRDGERLVQWCSIPHAVIVRPSNIVGVRDYYDEKAHVIPAFIRRAAELPDELVEGDGFAAYGDPSFTREFISSEDVAAGMLYAMARGKNKRAYNLGTNGENVISMGALAKHIVTSVRNHLGASPIGEGNIRFDNSRGGGDPARASDCSRAMDELGFYYEVDLYAAIESAIVGYLHDEVLV